MADLKNLPGVYVQKDDGNLRIFDQIPGNTILIIGASSQGPLETAYYVSDTQEAINMFGSGELIDNMQTAIETGSANNIVLFRVGGKGAQFIGVDGLNIKTKIAVVGAESKVTYKADAGVLTLLYDGVPAYASDNSIDQYKVGLLEVTGTFVQSILTNTATAISVQTVVSAYAGVAPAAITSATHGQKTITGVTNSATFLPGMKIKGANSELYEVSYVGEGSNANTVYLTTSIDTDLTTSNAKLVPNIFASTDGSTRTYIQKFEDAYRALKKLEAANVDVVYLAGTYADAPNVKGNDNQVGSDTVNDKLGLVSIEQYNGEYYFLWSQGVVGTGKPYKANITPKPFELGFNGDKAKTLLTGGYTINEISSATDLSSVVNDSAGTATFYEANFAYILAEYLHYLSTNDNEAYGVIKMMPPVNGSATAKQNWLGSFPVYNPTSGAVTKNGTGLKGWKFASGVVNQTPGLFLTAEGYVNGTPVTLKGQKVDIGRYLGVVAGDLTSSGASYDGACSYGAFYLSLNPINPTTNKTISSTLFPSQELTKQQVDDLIGLRYVAYSKNRSGNAKVADGITFALKTSDWARLSTCTIGKIAIDSLRTVAEPFIGSLINSQKRGALESMMNAVMKEMTNQGFLQAGMVTLRADRDMEIMGNAAAEVKMVTANELVRLTMYIALSK